MKVIGMDVKLDSHGKAHPWEIVLMDSASGEETSYHVKLPNKKYLSLPYDQRYGDLTESGISIEEVVDIISRKCEEDHDHKIAMAQWHFEGFMERSLSWNGCITIPVEVDDYEPDPVYDNRNYAKKEAEKVLRRLSK
jgi:hypothetical protein